jgi:hypothetical protein
MTTFKMTAIQGLTAAAVAVSLTWVAAYGFVDSTRVARWVQVAQVATTLVANTPALSASEQGAQVRLIQ